MKWLDIGANVVALSGIAIAIGIMVDMGVVVCENILKHRQEASPNTSLTQIILKATSEVSHAVLTALSTTVISFLPVFTMEAAEGKFQASGMDQDPCPDLCIAGVSVCDSRRCPPADGKARAAITSKDLEEKPTLIRKPLDRRSADLPAPGKILVPHGSGVGSGVEPALHHMPCGGCPGHRPADRSSIQPSAHILSAVSQNLPEFTSGFGFDGFAELARL